MKIPYLVKRQQLSWIAVGFLTISFMVTGYSILYGYVTDNVIHPPPTTGTYAYNTFKPGALGFPAVGGTYVDPVFGGIVRRLTNTVGEPNADDIYGHHWANANGTYSFNKLHSGGMYQPLRVINAVTGAEVYANQPEGLNASEVAWDPIDPDKYYFFSGASLMRRNLAAQTNTTIKTFPATLEPLGGSLNWMDRTGRYVLVKYSGQARVWDSQTDTTYAGAFTPVNVGGYVAMTPDGNYLVDAVGPAASPQREHHSHLINHATQTVGSATQFWGLCGDHASLSSASNGKNYMITFNCHSTGGIYRVDITLDQAGRSEAQQLADNQLLFATDIMTMSGHFSSVSKGALSDWVFISTESSDDLFDSTPTGWKAYKQEIVAVNLVTLEKRRLAHHRSRNLGLGGTIYSTYPRVSCSWDGSIVLWTSDFNISLPAGYADLYAIPFSTSSGVTPPTAPQNLRIN